MTAEPKTCVDCGAAFKRSRADSTVRCPACRKARHFAQSSYVPVPPSRYDIGFADGKAGRERLKTGSAAYHEGYEEGAKSR